MELKLIGPGRSGELVTVWQEFLYGDGFYWLEAHGTFDEETTKSTKAFQEENALVADGWVGPKTWSAALEGGFHIVEDDEPDDEDMLSQAWPPHPDFGPTDYITRQEYFGKIEFRPAPRKGNLEAVTITNNWHKDHIVSVRVPQLEKIPGIYYQGRVQASGPPQGNVMVHEKVAEPLQALWERWEEEGLLHRVLTWHGLWAPRFVRGSRTNLSNHAYGTAFDINAPWNGLRKTPALVGKKGSVRELIPIANELGWFWGGHFRRKDGMHLEYVPQELR